MKEIYRHHDLVRVSYFYNLLEQEDIPLMLRNEHASTGIVEVPIPEFYPNICVMNDDDYPRAWEILNKALNSESEGSDTILLCPSCKEENPGNFDLCYACEADLK